MRLLRLLKNDLAKETREWVDDDIINESQAIKICDRYQADYHQSKHRSFGYNVLVALGYLFIGLAIITILGANWDEIPRALRMAGLIAVTLLTHGLAIKKLFDLQESAATGLFLLAGLSRTPVNGNQVATDCGDRITRIMNFSGFTRGQRILGTHHKLLAAINSHAHFVAPLGFNQHHCQRHVTRVSNSAGQPKLVVVATTPVN